MSTMTLYEPLRKWAQPRARCCSRRPRGSGKWMRRACAERRVVTDGSRRVRWWRAGRAASKLPVPATPPLKDRDFKYIGKVLLTLARQSLAKATPFGIDVALPGAGVHPAVAHASFGAKVKEFRRRRARAVKGVVDVKQVASGIAVPGEHTWAALKGRDALKVGKWDLAGDQALERGAALSDYRQRLKTGKLARLRTSATSIRR